MRPKRVPLTMLRPLGRRVFVRCGTAAFATAVIGQGRSEAQRQTDVWLEDHSLDRFSDSLRTIRSNLVLDVEHLRQSDAPGVVQWRDAVGRFEGLRGRDRIAAVNDFVNRRIAYLDDWQGYGVSDHWAVLSETLQHGTGDCHCR